MIPPQYKCYAGCGKLAVLNTRHKHAVPMCPTCRKDKAKCSKARYAWFKEKKQVRDEAARRQREGIAQRVAAGATREDAKRDAEKETSEWLRAREAEFNARYESELMNPREALSLGSISEIVDPGDLRSVLAGHLDFLIRHYVPGPMESVQREFH